jgi:hypothetical protein
LNTPKTSWGISLLRQKVMTKRWVSFKSLLPWLPTGFNKSKTFRHIWNGPTVSLCASSQMGSNSSKELCW